MEFIYQAITPVGKRVSSNIAAEDREHATRLLQAQGMVLLNLEAGKSGGGHRDHSAKSSSRLKFGSKKIKLDQVAAMSRELAIMVETGVPLAEAITSLIEHGDNPRITKALQATHRDISEGKTISEAMAPHKELFPNLYVAMVRTAETGGSLGETLNQAAEYLESSVEMKRKVNGAMTYPLILLAVAVLVVLFMLTVIIPQFSQMFAKMGATVPPTTKIMMWMSDVLVKYWYAIPFVFGGSIFGFKKFAGSEKGRDIIVRVAMKMPLVGDTVKKIAMARILRSLGTLQASGVSLVVSLDTAVQTAQNSVYEKAIASIKQSIEVGSTLTDSMVRTNVFPPLVCQMISAGEKSGRLSMVLLKVAGFYERDVDAKLKTLASALEPIMIVVLGGIVGFMAVSIITPIYSMMDTVK